MPTDSTTTSTDSTTTPGGITSGGIPGGTFTGSTGTAEISSDYLQPQANNTTVLMDNEMDPDYNAIIRCV